jgi:hypothetical protein
MQKLAISGLVGTPVVNDNSGTTIAAADWVQLSSALPTPAAAVEIFNTSARAIKLAVGAEDAEVEIPYVVPPSAIGTIIPVSLKKGVRLSAKALGTDATTGFLVINFLG